MKKIFLFFSMLILIFYLTACNNAKSNENEISTVDQFVKKYNDFNDTESALLDLENGDIIDVDIVNTSGNLNIKLEGNDNAIIYQGNNVPTSSFQINISEIGPYKLTVTGKKATGSVSFTKKDTY